MKVGPNNLIHASAVAVGSSGLLICGRSGAGKSSLALELIALGANLVADDQVLLTEKDGGLLMSAPPSIDGMIEARGLGLISVPTQPAWACFLVDMDKTETDRLPELRETVIRSTPVRTFYRVESRAFPSMLYVLLQGGMA